jgi:hypothetical protein
LRILLSLAFIGALFVSGAINADTRIRAGNAFTDSTGAVWAPDSTFVTGGTLYTEGGTVSGTPDPTLYLSHRYGTLTYRIPAAGRVRVRLHFAEVYFTSAGQRVFVATIEGVAQTLDVFATAGGRNAYQLTAEPEVTDGELTIAFTPGAANNPMVSAIEVTQVDAPTEEPTAFRLPQPSCELMSLFELKIKFGSPGAIVVWCDEVYGMRRYYRTWTEQKTVATPSTTEWREVDKVVFTRVSTLQEHGVVSELTRRFAPKCYARTSGTATSVPVYAATDGWVRGAQRRTSTGALMTIASNAEVGCDARLLLSTRYCLAQGRRSSNGETIPLNSFALCTVQKAPGGGWEPP